MGSVRGRAVFDFLRHRLGIGSRGAPYDTEAFWNNCYGRSRVAPTEWAGVSYESLRAHDFTDVSVHIAHRARSSAVGRFEDLVPRTARVLHVGCGTSRFGDDMWADGYQGGATMLDFAELAVRWRRDHEDRDSVSWVQGDARDLEGLGDGAFDAVLDKGTIDATYLGFAEGRYDTDIDRIVRAANRVLVPQRGTFVAFSLTNPKYLWKLMLPSAEAEAGWDLAKSEVRYASSPTGPSIYLYVLRKARAPAAPGDDGGGSTKRRQRKHHRTHPNKALAADVH